MSVCGDPCPDPDCEPGCCAVCCPGREATAWKCWGCGGPDPADCEPDCPAWVEAMGDD